MSDTSLLQRIEKAKARQRERMITLRQLLVAMDPAESLPDEWDKWDDFRPQKVVGFDPEEQNTLNVWLDYEDFIRRFTGGKVNG